jgi:exopolysaccharide production protein ExoZ
MLNNVQGLRAFAAWIVILVHLSLFNTVLLESAFDFGHYGVDVFFVISGFVMVYTTSRKMLTPSQFFLNRVVRIVPLYWSMTIAVFFVAVIAPYFLKSTSDSLIELIKSLFFVPYLKSNGKIHPVLFPGWTLNYEMFFYAVFSLSLFISSRLKQILFVVIVLLALVVAGQIVEPTGTFGTFYTSPLLLEFGAGMLVGLAYPLLLARPVPIIWSVALMTVGTLVIVFAPVGTQLNRVLVIGSASTILVCGALMLEARGWKLRSPLLLLAGAASYAVYLSHPFVVGAIQLAAGKMHLLGGVWLWPALLVALGIASAVGIAIHLLLERPVDRYLRGRLHGKSPIPIGLALWPWRRKSGRAPDVAGQ